MSHKQRKLGAVTIGDIYCINLKIREEKMKRMKRQAKKKGFWPLKFHKVKLHENPKRGCLESHLEVIRMAKKRKLPNVLILEDDAKMLLPYRSISIPPVPEDWDMVYLGANVQNYFYVNDDSADANTTEPQQMYDSGGTPGDTWRRARMWTTHAYLIRDTLYDRVLKEGKAWQSEIDVFYKDVIHQEHRCYVLNPVMFSQYEGYSDIEQRNVDYAGLLEPHKKQRQRLDMAHCEYERLEEGGSKTTLKLKEIASNNELPCVSIVTPTYNHREMFAMAVYNWHRFHYPMTKMEWIIIDDSDEGQDVQDLLPEDGRIRYFRSKKRLNLSHKRNLCVKKAKYDVIVHMDDDDYYPPESVLSRVRVLMTYPDRGCVGSTLMGLYDLKNDSSALALGTGRDGSSQTLFAEASMAYHRKFWEETPFDTNVERGEGLLFTEKRLNQVIDVPYAFIMFAITHNKNSTGKLREVSKSYDHNFPDLWDMQTQTLVKSLRMSLYGLGDESAADTTEDDPEVLVV